MRSKPYIDRDGPGCPTIEDWERKDMKVEIKKDPKAYNKFAVKMELTEGAILALANGLQKHADSGSAVAADVLAFVWAAGEKAGITFVK